MIARNICLMLFISLIIALSSITVCFASGTWPQNGPDYDTYDENWTAEDAAAWQKVYAGPRK